MRPSTKHKEVFQKLHKKFLSTRSKGLRIQYHMLGSTLMPTESIKRLTVQKQLAFQKVLLPVLLKLTK